MHEELTKQIITLSTDVARIGTQQANLQETFTEFVSEIKEFIRMERNDHAKMQGLIDTKEDIKALVTMVGDIKEVVTLYKEKRGFKKVASEFIVEITKLAGTVAALWGAFKVLQAVFGWTIF